MVYLYTPSESILRFCVSPSPLKIPSILYLYSTSTTRYSTTCVQVVQVQSACTVQSCITSCTEWLFVKFYALLPQHHGKALQRMLSHCSIRREEVYRTCRPVHVQVHVQYPDPGPQTAWSFGGRAVAWIVFRHNNFTCTCTCRWIFCCPRLLDY